MRIVRTTVPLADVKHDLTLQRIFRRLEQGKQADEDIIALAKYLRDDLKVDVLST